MVRGAGSALSPAPRSAAQRSSCRPRLRWPRDWLAAHKTQNHPSTYSEIVRLCRKHGIICHFSNIIGFPEDTAETVHEHLDVLRDEGVELIGWRGALDDAACERLARFALQLEERSPLKVLERGYAIPTDANGIVLRDAAQVQIGDSVGLQLHRGKLSTEVKKKEV